MKLTDPMERSLFETGLNEAADRDLYSEELRASETCRVQETPWGRCILLEGMRVIVPDEVSGDLVDVEYIWPEFDSFKCEPYWRVSSHGDSSIVYITRKGWKKVNEELEEQS